MFCYVFLLYLVFSYVFSALLVRLSLFVDVSCIFLPLLSFYLHFTYSFLGCSSLILHLVIFFLVLVRLLLSYSYIFFPFVTFFTCLSVSFVAAFVFRCLPLLTCSFLFLYFYFLCLSMSLVFTSQLHNVRNCDNIKQNRTKLLLNAMTTFVESRYGFGSMA